MCKRIIHFLSVLFLLGACSFDDSSLREALGEQQQRIAALEALCAGINKDVKSLQILLGQNFISSYEAMAENGAIYGYRITLIDGRSIDIPLPTDGYDGADGGTPLLGVKKDADGNYFWTLGGEFIIVDGHRLPATGEEGTSPILDIRDGWWTASYDGGVTWQPLFPATTTSTASAIFSGVDASSGTYVILYLASGGSLTLPLKSSFRIGDDGSREPLSFIISASIPLKLPYRMPEKDFSALMVRIRTADGSVQAICTKSESVSRDDWSLSLKQPVFSHGNLAADPSVTVTYNGDGRDVTATLEAALIWADGSVTMAERRISATYPSGNQPGWFELPEMHIRKSGSYSINLLDASQYYSNHSFSMAGVKYRNFTVCFSAEHHVPLWVAAPRHPVYSQKGTSRSENYRPDPGIPSSVQYYSKSIGGGCNKGHMLGSAERLCCSDANNQVFYYSNIAPQLADGFNTGGGGWNYLEDFVDKFECADTLYEVVGTWFEPYTDGHGFSVSPVTITFGNRPDVHMPTMFYYVLLRTKKGNSGKSIANCDASELMCAAFVRSHTNALAGQRVTRADIMSVSELEKLTGLVFFANVPNAPKDKCSPSDWGL